MTTEAGGGFNEGLVAHRRLLKVNEAIHVIPTPRR
jgi:hypothetical protein